MLLDNFQIQQNNYMTMPLQRRRTELVEDVYIPPLKIPVQVSPSQKNKDATSLTFFKSIPLVQNTDFLKQKSLYRYAISRKPCRNQMTRSYAYLPQENTHSRFRSKSKVEQSGEKERSLSKNNSVQQIKDEVIQSRQPYFKRKNRNNPETLKQKQFGEKSNKASIYNQNFMQNKKYSKLDNEKCLINNKQTKLRTTDANGNRNFQQLYQKLQAKVNVLQKRLQELQIQKKILENKLREKESRAGDMEKQLMRVSVDNDKLLHQIKRNIKIHTDNFINENKLQSQLILRDNIIHQLQTSLKYIELENVTFKKYKDQCSKQADTIYKLQKDKKHLEEKIKILCRRKTKRSKTKGSLISQYSDLSLNFSLDQQDHGKHTHELKTAERTPQKLKNSYKPMIKSQQRRQLAPSWKQK